MLHTKMFIVSSFFFFKVKHILYDLNQGAESQLDDPQRGPLTKTYTQQLMQQFCPLQPWIQSITKKQKAMDSIYN